MAIANWRASLARDVSISNKFWVPTPPQYQTAFGAEDIPKAEVDYTPAEREELRGTLGMLPIKSRKWRLRAARALLYVIATPPRSSALADDPAVYEIAVGRLLDTFLPAVKAMVPDATPEELSVKDR